MRNITALLLFSSIPSVAQAADLAEITLQLREVQTSIDSVRLEYVSESPPLDDTPSLTLHSILLLSGRALRVTHMAPEVGTQSQSFDGKLGYQAITLPDDPTSMSTLVIDVGAPLALLGENSPMKWFGVPVEPTSQPLWKLLQGATITGESEFHDWPVVDVDLGRVTNRGGGTQQITCKLSIEHDFAPVQFKVHPTEDAQHDPLDYHVESFRKVQHPLLGRPIWFPEEMRGWDGGVVRLKSIELNPDIPADEFVIAPEIGTRVTDKTLPAGPLGGPRMYVHGADKLAKQRVDEARDMLPIPDDPVRAVPPRSIFGRTAWFLTGLVLLITAAVWSWRYRS